MFQAVTPVVELPAAAPAKEVGPADVLIGSIGLVGALAVLALMAGLLFGGLFILRRRAARTARHRRRARGDAAQAVGAAQRDAVNASSASVRTATPVAPFGE